MYLRFERMGAVTFAHHPFLAIHKRACKAGIGCTLRFPQVGHSYIRRATLAPERNCLLSWAADPLSRQSHCGNRRNGLGPLQRNICPSLFCERFGSLAGSVDAGHGGQA